ncbi:hypothetical protein FACS189449_10900 [Alphaproteobacteria bacterium]|nr:hypothetical protein FACS189449_10900 [Alphaproteobacteria bacterium]
MRLTNRITLLCMIFAGIVACDDVYATKGGENTHGKPPKTDKTSKQNDDQLKSDVETATKFVDGLFKPFLFTDPHQNGPYDGRKEEITPEKLRENAIAEAMLKTESEKCVSNDEKKTPLTKYIAATVYLVIGLRIGSNKDSTIYGHIARIINFMENRFGTLSIDDRKTIAAACAKIIKEKNLNDFVYCPKLKNEKIIEKIKTHLIKLCYLLQGIGDKGDIAGFYSIYHYRNLEKVLPLVAKHVEELRNLNFAASVYCPISEVLLKLKGEDYTKKKLSKKEVVNKLKEDAEIKNIADSIAKSVKFYKPNGAEKIFMATAWEQLSEIVIQELYKAYGNQNKWSKDALKEEVDRLLVSLNDQEENKGAEDFCGIIGDIYEKIIGEKKEKKKKTGKKQRKVQKMRMISRWNDGIMLYVFFDRFATKNS